MRYVEPSMEYIYRRTEVIFNDVDFGEIICDNDEQHIRALTRRIIKMREKVDDER